jgi:hypothetical protein
MNWQQKIEAQIAELQNSCYLVDEHGAEIGVSEHAASVQALLDVAVAAYQLPHRHGHEDTVAIIADIESALDKLREMDDHNPRGEDCFCPVCTGVL